MPPFAFSLAYWTIGPLDQEKYQWEGFFNWDMGTGEEGQAPKSGPIGRQPIWEFLTGNVFYGTDILPLLFPLGNVFLSRSYSYWYSVCTCCDVLACLRKAARHDPYSTLAVYEHNKKITMINYVPRKNSSVFLLT
ncbi:hypothetical protein Tsp_14955 [Trichinella spiralis]|uniref:hypothetical protein n=1 Tax=Trichinella spiralis TaxID=6334 RepID=UPI0001EFDCCD|nr:hypothetical protein Tsp_14955 [Trichinella spiralis]